MAIEQSSNLSDEVTEGRSSVRAEEERVVREGCIVADRDRRAEGIEMCYRLVILLCIRFIKVF